jgi:hypothetical protein
MYLFDAKSFTNLWYFIRWCRFYAEDTDLFETETEYCKKTKRNVLWVWLKNVDEPIEE